MDMMKPSAALLCKLGSIAVHADELISPDGHQFDHVALASLMADAEVQEWIAAMDGAAMLPKKRNSVPNEPSSPAAEGSPSGARG